MVKYWVWYDWIMLGIRLLASVSIILATLNFQDGLTLPLWIIILWEIIAFSVPWVALLFNYKYYLFTEIFLYGGLCIYLTSLFPEAYNIFLYQCFLSQQIVSICPIIGQLNNSFITTGIFMRLRQVIAIGLWSPIMDSHM